MGSISILETPQVQSIKELWKKYNEHGAVLFCERESKEDKPKIIAVKEFNENSTPEERRAWRSLEHKDFSNIPLKYQKAFQENSTLQNTRVLVIDSFKELMEYTTSLYYTAEDYFLVEGRSVAYRFRKLFERYQDSAAFKVVIRENEENGKKYYRTEGFISSYQNGCLEFRGEDNYSVTLYSIQGFNEWYSKVQASHYSAHKKFGKKYSGRDKTIREAFRDYIEQRDSYPRLLDYLSENILGQEQELRRVATIIHLWMKSIAYNLKSKNNFLLAGPSGCGKTELFRTIRDFFEEYIVEIPVIQCDVSNLSTAGFKGKCFDSLFTEFFNSNTNGIGIMFMDEFDKLLLPISTSSGENVNRQIQGQMLTAIEGTVMSPQKDSSAKDKVSIDTNNTLFIGAGAYYTEREKCVEVEVGFLGKSNEEKRENFYKDMDMEGIMDAGCMTELLGRFTTVINFHNLSYEEVQVIVDRNVESMEEELDCTIIVSEQGYQYINECYSTEAFGVRTIINGIRNTLLDTYTELKLDEQHQDCCATIRLDGASAHIIEYYPREIERIDPSMSVEEEIDRALSMSQYIDIDNIPDLDE